jgi:hypothetical protein
VERFHRRLKNSLRVQLAGSDWLDHLPWVLLGLRAGLRHIGSRAYAHRLCPAAALFSALNVDKTNSNRAQTVAAQKLQGATQRVCAGAGSATGVPWTLPRTGAGGEILCPRGRR